MSFKFFQKGIISGYRVVMTGVLLIIVAGVLSYLFLIAFYALNRNWAAPIILSPTQEKVLSFQPQVATLEANLLKNRVDLNTANNKYIAITEQVTQMQALTKYFDLAGNAEAAALSTTNAQLERVLRQKRDDITRTAAAVDDVRPMLVSLDAELAAGLITKDEAARRRMDIQSAQNALTDSRANLVVLSEQARMARASSRTLTQADAASLSALQSLSSGAQLKMAVAQALVEASTAKESVAQIQRTVDEGERVLKIAKQSPYYRALNQKVPVVFIQYDNLSNAQPGSPVFDCYLQVVLCRKVGTVTQVYDAEEYARHPLFKSDIKGKFAGIEFTDPDASESPIVFLGRKPLLF
ncbi:hypothetical protein [Ralstonia sp. UNC404CL21Col]|uniref:hypothetical protein n=1 Tax=Ralstonia sp. UNC404CL21Col TaxID=1380362 RepID=UPI000480CD27|nr:hypothetical protein [Ralstonia sp. UNC404CL21Col]